MTYRLMVELNDDGRIAWTFDVPNGATVFRKNAAQLALAALTWCLAAPDARILTKSEAKAAEEAERIARALPDGWEPTLDGVNTELDASTGRQSWARTYLRPLDGRLAAAPCAGDGSCLPATRNVLESVPAPQVADAPAEQPGA